jgi:cell fate (sporulation/competence/biofilm development) regulator YmcA (YheA/YmcA/DUF963 family)
MRITEDELAQLLRAAAKAGVEEYKRQEKKARQQDRYHDTFSLMRRYRDAVIFMQHAEDETAKANTARKLEHIDAALEEIKSRRKAAGKETEYKAFELYFMDGLNYEQIVDRLNTGNNTPRRWVSGIINELSVLLWGLEDK